MVPAVDLKHQFLPIAELGDLHLIHWRTRLFSSDHRYRDTPILDFLYNSAPFPLMCAHHQNTLSDCAKCLLSLGKCSAAAAHFPLLIGLHPSLRVVRVRCTLNRVAHKFLFHRFHVEEEKRFVVTARDAAQIPWSTASLEQNAPYCTRQTDKHWHR